MSGIDDRRPDVAKELSRLKDFQRRTVDAVFARMYDDDPPARRFLVADEVGLGKTLVARGVVVRAIDRLWDKVGRIDIVYLCSNGDIARQNVARLTPDGVGHVPESPRITLLPLTTHDLGKRKVNVIPLTPGTSLKVAGSLGIKRERALLVHLLREPWGLDHIGACRLFTGTAKYSPFKAYVRDFQQRYDIDQHLATAFLDYLETICEQERANGLESIRERVVRLTNEWRVERRRSSDELSEQRKVIGELRQRLGQSCIRSLEPDLIILDEFQRFRDLLGGDSPEAEMASQLFEYEDDISSARVLLLSATPYKMYTTPDEANGESHYEDFVRTARFLLSGDPGKADDLSTLLRGYRASLFRAGHEDGLASLQRVCRQLEEILRGVMVRTERLAVTPDRSGMLAERPISGLTLESRDALSYRETARLGRLADQAESMEFWKASPWLLNFMEGYKLANRFGDLVESNPRDADLLSAVNASRHALVKWQDVEAFRRLDPAHGRLRWLLAHVLDAGLWRLLWLPPTLTYYRLAEPFRELSELAPTKNLLFSAWRVVPRVVASVLSHEAERRLYAALEGNDTDLTRVDERLGNLLRIARREGTIAGMTTLSVLYPCRWMAENCDPLDIARSLHSSTGRTPSVGEVLAEAERRLRPIVDKLTAGKVQRATPDESWYWALPVLIDLDSTPEATGEWLASDLAEPWGDGARKRKPVRQVDEEEEEEAELQSNGTGDGDDHSALGDFISRLRAVAADGSPAGVPPKDLTSALALMSIAGPATATLRSLTRVAGIKTTDVSARTAAARVGASFRTLFNQPDATAAVRLSSPHEDFWKQCLDYSAGLGIQAMLDEYAHLLMSELGLGGKTEEERATHLAERMSSVVGLRRAAIGVQDIHVANGAVRREGRRFRSRFAMRFGEERRDDDDQNVRADDVRSAFNSPFAPFVLATTSVGQEGLDFHFYCHSVVHWNLPPNPVDLEQREGRVHRFKGLAVRKNIVRSHAAAAMSRDNADQWEAMFELAKEARADCESDLLPYWVYPLKGGARIERHVPHYPLSRDIERLAALRNSLALYRMVFGQPRQEELVGYLSQVLSHERIRELSDIVRISLEPRA